MLLRIRSRDGLERVQVSSPHISISQLKTLIESQLQIPIQNQTLSTDHNLLLAKTAADLLRFTDMTYSFVPLSALNLTHGSMVFLFYQGERTVRGVPAVCPAGSFGRKMTVDDLIVNEALTFTVTYSSVSEEGRMEVDFICDIQQGLEDDMILSRVHEQEKLALQFASFSL